VSQKVKDFEITNAIEITACLEQWRLGDAAAIQQVYELIYAELKHNAASILRRLGANQQQAMTYSPTDLLHEVSARVLANIPAKKWNRRQEFYALMTKAMLNLLLGRHTQKASKKHGGGLQQTEAELHDVANENGIDHPDVIALDQALDALKQVDALRYQILQLHFFEGYTIEQIAEQLSLAKSTVSSKKTIALAWLRTHLEREPKAH
jgi:RNA polymerase sigma factor (TIGR02999 family)